MKKRFALLLCLVLMLGVLTGCGRGILSSSDFVIRVGHVLAPNHPYQIGIDYFKEIVEERSEGRISVETFHSSQLGNERDMIEGLQLGTVEMAIVSTAPLAGFTTDFYVFDMPFIFDGVDNARSVVDSEVGQKMLDDLREKGILGLCYFENGFRSCTNSRGAIFTPADLSGVKIRTMENPIHMESFRVMGADPTPMAFGELYTALQQKTIDAQENPLAIVDTSKFYEVQKYLSLTEHFYAPAPLLVAEEFYDGLSLEDQKLIKECALEARDFERQTLDEMNALLLSELEGYGMEINEVDKAPFIEAVQPVYEKYVGTGEDQISPELLKSVQEGAE